jgi:23S rRNA pseudouridine2605 synthase
MAKKKSSKPSELKPPLAEPEVAAAHEIEIPQAAIADPIGDETGGEAKAALEPEEEAGTEPDIEARSETEIAAEDGPEPEDSAEPGSEAGPEPSEAEAEPEFEPKPGAPADGSSSAGWKPRPPAKLERLQKILAKAGVASRRKAEELIEQGRVQVNGTVVTELGTKADAGRDHIRVDGKLLQGPERLRYFVLNKPRGFVTTVKDPEGRPTVIQFFDKMRERLYPVGRLDYLSEGLLLVTNDGELAHRLTRAGSGVEKTYLVKVAGQPSEAELDLLRGGVAIERGKPGSPQVRTAAARVRQVRQGDNPWYEVVLIEGRNRELRKMFEAIGHFVEKIRRVGYGPLVLDQEPGSLRELDAEELAVLRRAAEGKLHTPNAKELRRRNAADASQLPTVAPHTAGSRPAKPFAAKSFEERLAAGRGDYRPKRLFAQGAGADRPARPSGRDFGSARPTGRPTARPAWQKDDRPSRPPARFAARSAGEDRPAQSKRYVSSPSKGKPYGAKPRDTRPYGDRPATGGTYAAKPAIGGGFRERPATGRPFGDKPAARRPYGDKPASNKGALGKPSWSRPTPADRPFPKRPPASRRGGKAFEDAGPRKPARLHVEAVQREERPNRPVAPRAYSGRPKPSRPGADRPSSSRPASKRPFSGEAGLARPFTTSSGKLRAGGARPGSKPAGWKPKPSYGGPGRPASGARFKPKPGSSSKSAYKGKPSGPKHTGSPGGRKRG